MGTHSTFYSEYSVYFLPRGTQSALCTLSTQSTHSLGLFGKLDRVDVPAVRPDHLVPRHEPCVAEVAQVQKEGLRRADVGPLHYLAPREPHGPGGHDGAARL